jgi:hypothetical protein
VHAAGSAGLAAARPFCTATLAVMSEAETSAPPAAEEAVTRPLARVWLEWFRAQRVHLCAAVPGRSRQPARYRALIVQHLSRARRDARTSSSAGTSSCPDAVSGSSSRRLINIGKRLLGGNHG